MNDLNNLGVRASCCSPRRTGSRSRRRWTTRANAPTAIRRWSRASRPRCAPRTGSTADRRRSRYTPPSFNAFDRLTDVDTPLRSYQDLGGTSLNVDWKLGPGRLTSTTAWRYWDWNPSNDRDFIGLPVTTISAGTSKQRQWTQEIRYAGECVSARELCRRRLRVPPDDRLGPGHQAGTGRGRGAFSWRRARWRRHPAFSTGTASTSTSSIGNVSAALFGQLEWSVTDRLRLLPGLRFNYDQKDVDFDQQIYGGLQTTDPALIALQRSILAPQAYKADVDDTNLSGQITVAYKIAGSVNTYATYATGFKSVGLNLNGVPTDAADRPVLSAATVKPEDVHHVEVGLKTEPLPGVTANVTVYDTEIKDFQAQVVNAGVGVLRGYLANAREGARARRRVRRQRQGEPQSLVLRRRRLHRRQVHLLPGRAAPARGHRRAAGQGHLGLRPAWHLQMGLSSAASTRIRGPSSAGPGEFFGALDASYRSSFSSSASALEVSGGRRLSAAQRPGRLPVGGWLDALGVVPQPAEQGLFRVAHGGAWQHGSLCGAARRSQNRWRDDAVGRPARRDGDGAQYRNRHRAHDRQRRSSGYRVSRPRAGTLQREGRAPGFAAAEAKYLHAGDQRSLRRCTSRYRARHAAGIGHRARPGAHRRDDQERKSRRP